MDYLAPTYFFDYEHERIQTLMADIKDGSLSDKEKGPVKLPKNQQAIAFINLLF